MSNKRKGILGLIVAIMIGIGTYHWADAIPVLKNVGAPEISKAAETHILHGDARGGGHRFGAGKSCKSEFPKNWDDAAIINHVRSVAANDNLNWKKQRNGYYAATGKIDGIRMRVVLDKERDDVVTAYPLNTKRNACDTNMTATAKKTAPEDVMPSAANDNRFNE